MGFVPVPLTASVELIYEVMGQRCENVFHAKAGIAWSESSLTDLAETFKDWFIADGKGIMSSNTALSKIVCKDLASKSGPAIEYQTGLPISGTISNIQACPLNVTAAVSFGTALRGRSYRGRVFQIGLNVGQIADNALNSQYRAELISVYASLVSAVSTGGWDLAVVSRYTNKAPRSTGVATPITSVSVENALDSQRRRLATRGQ